MLIASGGTISIFKPKQMTFLILLTSDLSNIKQMLLVDIVVKLLREYLAIQHTTHKSFESLVSFYVFILFTLDVRRLPELDAVISAGRCRSRKMYLFVYLTLFPCLPICDFPYGRIISCLLYCKVKENMLF